MCDDINKQIKNALSINVLPILCIGEKVKESAIIVLKKQIKDALKGLKPTECKKIIFAYEPVKFIGKKTPNANKTDKFYNGNYQKNFKK